jgi:hypothetical protein
MFKKYQSPQLHSKTFTDLILKKKSDFLYIQIFSMVNLKT